MQMCNSVKMVLTKLLNIDRYLQFKLSHNPLSYLFDGKTLKWLFVIRGRANFLSVVETY